MTDAERTVIADAPAGLAQLAHHHHVFSAQQVCAVAANTGCKSTQLQYGCAAIATVSPDQLKPLGAIVVSQGIIQRDIHLVQRTQRPGLTPRKQRQDATANSGCVGRYLCHNFAQILEPIMMRNGIVVQVGKPFRVARFKCCRSCQRQSRLLQSNEPQPGIARHSGRNNLFVRTIRRTIDHQQRTAPIFHLGIERIETFESVFSSVVGADRDSNGRRWHSVPYSNNRLRIFAWYQRIVSQDLLRQQTPARPASHLASSNSHPITPRSLTPQQRGESCRPGHF